MDLPLLTYWYFFVGVIIVTLIHSWTLCHGDIGLEFTFSPQLNRPLVLTQPPILVMAN